ncbi:rcc01693 family protein [Maritalea sp.]|uniref:rcc01693 family protein n=1 Tax=Maritalea sp. TaxID=2003361 RepID=UPI003EF37D8D
MISKVTGFPWEDAARIGFDYLRLSPTAFWKLTPRELLMIAKASGHPVPLNLDRNSFEELARKYPDEDQINE